MMICATATNGASSWMYSPDSAPNDAMSSITLYIGLRWPMTSADAPIASADERVEDERLRH